MATFNDRRGQQAGGHGPGHGNAQALPNGITSAYNFAPLAQQVVCPPWQDLVSHDLPLKQGLSADLHIEVTAHTPLLVGAERAPAARPNDPAQVRFFTHPDGTPAIPGSSMRGMLRNVLEIASFSRLQLMDDRALSVRDLTSSDNEYMRKLVAGNHRSALEGARPLATPAWLWFDGENWRLERTIVARVEQDEIGVLFNLPMDVWPEHGSDEKKRWRKSAGEKYRLLFEAQKRDTNTAEITQRGLLKVRFVLSKDSIHAHSEGKFLAYKKVERLVRLDKDQSDAKPGALVVTGQGIPKKHMEFVFGLFARKADSRTVSAHAMTTFRRVYGHEDSDWTTHWASRAGQGMPVPVFYLELGGELQLGLSQMFRLAGVRSLGAMVPPAHQPDAVDAVGQRRLDFVETLFGQVNPDDQASATALKGRISVGDLRWSGSASGRPEPAAAEFSRPTVLAQPKPSFFPAYLQQTQANGVLKAAGAGQPTYKTVLADDAQLRGWKRYPVRPMSQVLRPDPPHRSRANVQTSLQALAPDNRFSGRIRLHNVTPEELGSVVWALTWGGNEGLRHGLGMGKPFGFGQIAIRITNAADSGAVQPNLPTQAGPDLAQCLAAFETFMQTQVPGWDKSATLRELLAMADPTKPQANRSNLSPLELQVGAGNQFVQAKSQRAVLQPYSKLGATDKGR